MSELCCKVVGQRHLTFCFIAGIPKNSLLCVYPMLFHFFPLFLFTGNDWSSYVHSLYNTTLCPVHTLSIIIIAYPSASLAYNLFKIHLCCGCYSPEKDYDICFTNSFTSNNTGGILHNTSIQDAIRYNVT